MKEFVAANPSMFKMPKSTETGETEHQLPSGDLVDVFFKVGQEQVGVEVKSRISGVDDIARGLYQCVKYQAVLEARQAAEGLPQNIRTFLVLESTLPTDLVPLKNVLGIEVYENVKPRK